MKDKKREIFWSLLAIVTLTSWNVAFAQRPRSTSLRTHPRPRLLTPRHCTSWMLTAGSGIWPPCCLLACQFPRRGR